MHGSSGHTSSKKSLDIAVISSIADTRCAPDTGCVRTAAECRCGWLIIENSVALKSVSGSLLLSSALPTHNPEREPREVRVETLDGVCSGLGLGDDHHWWVGQPTKSSEPLFARLRGLSQLLWSGPSLEQPPPGGISMRWLATLGGPGIAWDRALLVLVVRPSYKYYIRPEYHGLSGIEVTG